jgi:hypothetical protein
MDRHYLLAYFTYMQRHNREIKGSLQPSSKELGQEDALQAEQNKH